MYTVLIEQKDNSEQTAEIWNYIPNLGHLYVNMHMQYAIAVVFTTHILIFYLSSIRNSSVIVLIRDSKMNICSTNFVANSELKNRTLHTSKNNGRVSYIFSIDSRVAL